MSINLTLAYGEIWGGVRTLGCLAAFFKTFFQGFGFVDIASGKLVPTWRNNWAGTDLIEKRLDRDFISEDLQPLVGIYRSWVEYPYISDHAPILVQLDLPYTLIFYPFKMNPYWIQDLSFETLVNQL
jgi:hypothetical protein